MRRKAPTMPISPKQLKHFAVATVLLTGALALVAGGQDAGIAAQVSATQAKNDMIAKEQQKLGTKKVASNLKVRNQGGGFSEDGDEGGSGAGGGAGNGGFGDAASGSQSAQRRVLPPGAVQVGPDGKLRRKPTVRPYEGTIPKEGEGTASRPSMALSGTETPSIGPLDAAAAASRQRSGSSNSGGD